jgi:hypothetical protein
MSSPSEVLRDVEATGSLGGVEFEYYVGGGLPPPHYRSDQLRLLVIDGIDTFEFVTPKYDSELDPYPNYRYRLRASREEVRRVARLVRESGVLETSPPPKPAVEDLLRFEFLLRRGAVNVEKVFYGGLPSEYGSLRGELDRLVGDLKSGGERRLTHKGVEIPDTAGADGSKGPR